MSAFADSSALVKLYAEEEGSETVRDLDAVTVSALARVEVPAALWRKSRADELDAARAARLVRWFEVDLIGGIDERPRFAVIAARMPLLSAAAAAAATHSLRAYDAIQLASALAARAADPDCTRFACFDADLREAAAASGFTLIPE